LLDGNRHDGVFDLLCDAVFQPGFLRLISCRDRFRVFEIRNGLP
jgi:hypothetical protein